MNNDMKRRTFLAATVGTLIAAPVAVRFFTGNRKEVPHKHFAKGLKTYQNMVDVPIRPVDGPASFTLPLRPEPGNEWSYVLFVPSYMPNEVSLATPGEPDVFSVRTGRIGVARTRSDQTVILGADELFQVCSPHETDDRQPAEIALMLKDGKLFPAKEKGTQVDPNRDTQFEHLLAPAGLPSGELKVGKKWQAGIGRTKPFRFATNYEIAGFAEIDGRKTVNVRFDANVPHSVMSGSMKNVKFDKGETPTHTHSGNAWFDLESGLLVRQELDLASTRTKINGTDKDLTVKSKLYLQLFTV